MNYILRKNFFQNKFSLPFLKIGFISRKIEFSKLSPRVDESRFAAQNSLRG